MCQRANKKAKIVEYSPEELGKSKKFVSPSESSHRLETVSVLTRGELYIEFLNKKKSAEYKAVYVLLKLSESGLT